MQAPKPRHVSFSAVTLHLKPRSRPKRTRRSNVTARSRPFGSKVTEETAGSRHARRVVTSPIQVGHVPHRGRSRHAAEPYMSRAHLSKHLCTLRNLEIADLFPFPLPNLFDLLIIQQPPSLALLSSPTLLPGPLPPSSSPETPKRFLLLGSTALRLVSPCAASVRDTAYNMRRPIADQYHHTLVGRCIRHV